MEEAPSPGLHFHQFATMDSSEPGQNPTLPSFSHGFSPVAQDSQVGTDVNSPIDLTSPSESINFVPPADPVSLFTWLLFSTMDHRY